MANQYPTFSETNKIQPKDYPTFSQVNPTESIDVRLDAQGSAIQDQAIPKGFGSQMNSSNPLYDVNYDSGSAKTNNNQINNYPQNYPHNYPQNIPNYKNNMHGSTDEKYDAQNSEIYNQPISKDSYNLSNTGYDSNKKNIGGNYNYPGQGPVPQGMNPNMPPYPQGYGLVPPPHGPGMFPHHRHHHHHPHHIPPHFPPYPPRACPCEEEYYPY